MSATTFSAAPAQANGHLPMATVLVDKTKTIGNMAVKNAAIVADKMKQGASYSKAELLKFLAMVPTRVWLGLGALSLSTKAGYHKAVDITRTGVNYAGKIAIWAFNKALSLNDHVDHGITKIIAVFSETASAKYAAFALRMKARRQLASLWVADKAVKAADYTQALVKNPVTTLSVVWTSRIVLTALLLSVVFPPAAAFMSGLPLIGGLATAGAAGSLAALKTVAIMGASTAVAYGLGQMLGIKVAKAVLNDEGTLEEALAAEVVTTAVETVEAVNEADLPVKVAVDVQLVEDKETYTDDDIIVVNGTPLPIGTVLTAVKKEEAKADSQHRAQPRNKGKKH